MKNEHSEEMSTEEYAVSVCSCGSRDISLIDGPWTDPRIHCNLCGAWAVGDTRQDVVNRWNKCAVKREVQAELLGD